MGISDIIEKFLHDLINRDEDGSIEIQRNTLANRFGCVPSQINYVIQTRFTNERGYTVESRRGGGGYIKIKKVTSPDASYCMHIVNSIGEGISYDTAAIFIKNMHEYGLISAKEGNIMLAAISDKVLTLPSPERDVLRADILKNMLVTLNM